MYEHLNDIINMGKSDLHNHSTRGGNIRDFVPYPIKEIPSRTFLRDLNEMQSWFNDNIRQFLSGKEGFEARVRSAFKQAENDGIKRLSMSFGLGDAQFYDNRESFIQAIKQMSEVYSGDFTPELGFLQFQNPIDAINDLAEVIEYDYFKAIDLFGNDQLPLNHFKPVFDMAGKHGLRRKAHVGEFGNANSIVEAIKVLNLDAVQHGIAAVHSKRVMEYIKDSQVVLNICPSSNVYLKRVKSYKEHPIGELFRSGIKVTINTDDMLIFDQSVSQEYHNLFTHGVLEADELEEIRKIGLKV